MNSNNLRKFVPLVSTLQILSGLPAMAQNSPDQPAEEPSRAQELCDRMGKNQSVQERIGKIVTNNKDGINKTIVLTYKSQDVRISGKKATAICGCVKEINPSDFEDVPTSNISKPLSDQKCVSRLFNLHNGPIKYFDDDLNGSFDDVKFMGEYLKDDELMSARNRGREAIKEIIEKYYPNRRVKKQPGSKGRRTRK